MVIAYHYCKLILSHRLHDKFKKNSFFKKPSKNRKQNLIKSKPIHYIWPIKSPNITRKHVAIAFIGIVFKETVSKLHQPNISFFLIINLIHKIPKSNVFIFPYSFSGIIPTHTTFFMKKICSAHKHRTGFVHRYQFRGHRISLTKSTRNSHTDIDTASKCIHKNLFTVS